MTAETVAALDRLTDAVLLAEAADGISSAPLLQSVSRFVGEMCQELGRRTGRSFNAAFGTDADVSLEDVVYLVSAEMGPMVSTELTAAAGLVQHLARQLAEIREVDVATVLRDAVAPLREMIGNG